MDVSCRYIGIYTSCSGLDDSIFARSVFVYLVGGTRGGNSEHLASACGIVMGVTNWEGKLGEQTHLFADSACRESW